MDELAQLTGLCRGLGAPAGQAESMARQLIKRADQLVVERGQAREEAMAYLLRLVVQGRQGEVPPEFRPPTPGAENQNRPDSSAK
ncbi:MAG: hypothetical protein HYX71_04735 [Opitutae bacterium]|nr:hypothetical protein [Opitutae bacterium]